MKKSNESKALVQLSPGVRALTLAGVTIYERGFRSYTTSLEIAARFGKEHKNVLRAIDNLECSEQFNRLNFEPVDYLDEKGERRPMFEVSRDGFSFLAMGFTGKKAAAWKENFIAAFNALEHAVLRAAQQKERRAQLDWQAHRALGKAVRHQETDQIKRFVDYATAQGSENAARYYITLTSMPYKALGLLELVGGPVKGLRDRCDILQLGLVQVADMIVSVALADGMAEGRPYKDIYKLARERVEAYAAAVPSAARVAETMGRPMMAAVSGN